MSAQYKMKLCLIGYMIGILIYRRSAFCCKLIVGSYCSVVTITLCRVSNVQNGSSRTESVMQNCLVRAARLLHQHLLLARCPLLMTAVTKLTVNHHAFRWMFICVSGFGIAAIWYTTQRFVYQFRDLILPKRSKTHSVVRLQHFSENVSRLPCCSQVTL